MPEGQGLEGTVVRIEGTAYKVDLADGSTDVTCVLAGRLKKGRKRHKQPVVVGDRVTLAAGEDRTGVIGAVAERRTKLSRRSAGHGRYEQIVVTNVDQLLVVASLASPPFRPGLIDRMLVAAAQGHLDPVICLNKIDLAADRVDALAEPYRRLGYRVVACSATHSQGLDQLEDVLSSKSTVLAGHSGVGKSSLINALQPGLEIRTGEISRSSDRGKHTTTTVSLLKLDFGGYVVDTPGIRAFSIWDLDPVDLDIFFREFEQYIDRCKYPTCAHTHEPHCAVKEAVDSGAITRERYDSYSAIYTSLIEDDARRR